jgi:hypothetical protein
MLWLVAVLLLVLGWLFLDSFKPGEAVFANDGPLGAQVSDIYKMPGAFFGIWSDLYWLGAYGGNYAPNATGVLLWVLGPLAFNKFLVPISMLLLGLSAAVFYRQLGFGLPALVLGGVAAALNSNFFSNACWGLSSRALSLAAAFLALAAVQSSLASRGWVRWAKTVLAGLAIGLSVSEGGDNGAIFSLFIAAYAFYVSFVQEGPLAGRVANGVMKVGLMAVMAAFLAFQTISVFFHKDVSGGPTTGGAGMSKERHWAWATQWSLPKLESFRVIVPGLFGYRLDTENGGSYWGGVGQEPGWEEGHNDPEWVKAHPNAFPRHSGAGEYAGIAVVLIAIWALAHSFVRNGSYSNYERSMIRFWGAAALLALLLSWGRHAPFYRLVDMLPYFRSEFRNPMKFMHPCHMALMILFAYGVEGLWRRYVEPFGAAVTKLKGASAPVFDRRTPLVLGLVGGLAMLTWIVYASAQTGLARFLTERLAIEPTAASAIARFSSGEVGMSVFFLLLTLGLIFAITRGFFSGNQVVWPTLLLALLMTVDFARANRPWIKHYDYKAKYASDAILATLATNAYQHRVTMPPLQWDRNFAIFQQVYGVEWLQHQFPFYNIQSLDIPQEPRMPADKAAYREALATNIVRLWELTNTRFICGMAGNFADVLNQQLDPVQRRFRVHTRFNFSQDPGTGNITARVDENGLWALLEFTGALPRAQLYSQWKAKVDDTAALSSLANPAFNPHNEVLVAEAIDAPQPTGTNSSPGTVEFVRYSPKQLSLTTRAISPSVLLLNDHYDPSWQATVDGKAVPILRCNYMMRGIQLSPGEHTVEFRYRPSSDIFYVSLTFTLLGLALLIVLCWQSRASARDSFGANS